MPLVDTANFTLTGMTAKRRFGDRLRDRYLTPQDFGEGVGLGTNDDTAAIQALFDYAVPETEADAHLAWVMRFPSGLYKISAPILLKHSWGVMLLGAGSHQSRIFWDPEAPAVESAEIEDFFPVIEVQTCNLVHMSGLTFDASGVQNTVMHCCRHVSQIGAPGGGYGDGTDGFYRDIHVTGAVESSPGVGGTGVAYSGIAMGSERTWFKCKFTNCPKGYLIVHGNTINHFFYQGVFKDNGYGIYNVGQGGSIVVNGCWSENNSIMDYYCFSTPTRIQSCHSKSENFAASFGYVGGNTHDNASDEGFFFTNSNSGGFATAFKSASLVGNHSTNGQIDSDASNGNATHQNGLYLLGNLIENPDRYDYMLTHYRASAMLWEDGAQINPPPIGIWNAVNKWGPSGFVSDITLSGGNLVATAVYSSGAAHNVCISATTSHFHSKWYFEITVTSLPSGNWGVGISDPDFYINDADVGSFAGNDDVAGTGVTMPATAGNAAGYAKFNNGTSYTFDTDPTIANGSVIGVAMNATLRKVWFRHNGTWLKGDPAAGTDGCDMTGITWGAFPYVYFRPASNPDGVLTLNLGATSFAGSLPTGFLAWG